MPTERFPVEATHIMMFARSVGDTNPAFCDPESEEAKSLGGVVAPPTFAMAAAQFDPENPLIPRPGEPWFGSGKTAGFKRAGGAVGILHAEQRFEYHRPMRAGDVLTGVPGEDKEWEKESKRGGLLKFSEAVTDYKDIETDELVVSVTMVTVQTSKPVSQED